MYGKPHIVKTVWPQPAQWLCTQMLIQWDPVTRERKLLLLNPPGGWGATSAEAYDDWLKRCLAT